MATRLSLCSSPMLLPKHSSSRGKTNGRLVVKCANNPTPVGLQRRSPHKNKVFEDRSVGIVCYKDENGEITCEGYDEGPRLYHQLSRFCYNTRDAEIIEILERCWLQVADENEFSNGDKGVA
ncbi:hypothetical protein CDL12_06041 [Handroanthus impetiginosus]|uniref:Uncharacterized protein n=1 Tax=Handroanthus impetiginosus TaxID=429701 RepID=A0A2G9HUR0_9LAMI|nr:hypothetical protein CDL12_06041 [Handroanthus impetiginosus]